MIRLGPAKPRRHLRSSLLTRLLCDHTWVEKHRFFMPGEGSLVADECYFCRSKRWRMVP